MAALLACACGAALAMPPTGDPAARPPATMAAPPKADKKQPPAKPVKRVDINHATRAELMKLPGIGEAEADQIIAARPFLSKVDLVTNKILPEGVYLSIKNQIVAVQKAARPAAKK